MNDRVKKFSRQALKARTAATDADSEQIKRQWLLTAEIWDLLVHEGKRNPETVADDEASVRRNFPNK